MRFHASRMFIPGSGGKFLSNLIAAKLPEAFSTRGVASQGRDTRSVRDTTRMTHFM